MHLGAVEVERKVEVGEASQNRRRSSAQQDELGHPSGAVQIKFRTLRLGYDTLFTKCSNGRELKVGKGRADAYLWRKGKLL
jgi:hypothetical protein